jgi:hypothetical protein
MMKLNRRQTFQSLAPNWMSEYGGYISSWDVQFYFLGTVGAIVLSAPNVRLKVSPFQR